MCRSMLMRTHRRANLQALVWVEVCARLRVGEDMSLCEIEKRERERLTVRA